MERGGGASLRPSVPLRLQSRQCRFTWKQPADSLIVGVHTHNSSENRRENVYSNTERRARRNFPGVGGGGEGVNQGEDLDEIPDFRASLS